MTVFIDVLLVVAILGTGIVSGVFYAFSGFVTQGLHRLPAADAARAMREINVTAVRPPLMLAIFGTALLVVALIVFAVAGQLAEPWWAVAGAVVYLVGVVGVTGGANVPRNNRLAAAPATDDAALAAAWSEFRSGWQAWNHVRTLTSAVACVCLVVALVG